MGKNAQRTILTISPIGVPLTCMVPTKEFACWVMEDEFSTEVRLSSIAEILSVNPPLQRTMRETDFMPECAGCLLTSSI